MNAKYTSNLDNYEIKNIMTINFTSGTLTIILKTGKQTKSTQRSIQRIAWRKAHKSILQQYKIRSRAENARRPDTGPGHTAKVPHKWRVKQ